MINTRIPTFYHAEEQKKFLSQSQSGFAQTQTQLSSGMKSTIYSDCANDTQDVLKAILAQGRSQSFLQLNAETNVVLKTYELQLDAMKKIFTDFAVLCVQANNGAVGTKNEAFKMTAEGLENGLVRALNTKDYKGLYLFSGVKTNICPVQMDQYDPEIAEENLSYFKGSAVTQPVLISDQCDPLDFQITADHPAFEKAIRAFRLAQDIDMGPPQDADAFAEVIALIESAIVDLNDDVYMKLFNAQRTLETKNEQLEAVVHQSALAYAEFAETEPVGTLISQETLRQQMEISASISGKEIQLRSRLLDLLM